MPLAETSSKQSSVETQESSDIMANYKFERGGNWNKDNVHTILQWIHICSINLDVMTEASFHYKRLIRRNTILSLLMSTITSTASLTQFNISEETYPGLSTAIKIIITVLATIIALSSGFIKIYQIQEKLEKAIKLQQEWTSFGSTLSSELQLPTNLRKDALYLIIKYKDIYTELFKQQADVSKKIITRVAQRNNLEPNDLMLSELFERIIYSEADRLSINMNGKDILHKTNTLTSISKRLTNDIVTENISTATTATITTEEKTEMLKEALREITENKSVGQEACNTLDDQKVIIDTIIENNSELEEEQEQKQEQKQEDKTIISMSGIIVPKITSVNTSKKSETIINAKDRIKNLISSPVKENSPQQQLNRKRMSNLVVNSTIRK